MSEENLLQEEIVASLNNIEPVQDIEDDKMLTFADKGWSDKVIAELDESERVGEDRVPKVDGLRRVVEKFVGKIIESYPTVLQCPRFTGKTATSKDGKKAYILEPAIVQWTLVVDSFDGEIRKFGDVASVYLYNTDYEYSLHAIETAGTKAESRALRKLLRIKNITSEEKFTNKDKFEEQIPVDDTSGPMNSSEKTVLQSLCGRKKITLDELFEKEIKTNPDYSAFNSIHDITSEVAKKLIRKLQE